MRTPILSIIVPVYNKEKYLSACINSILSQTFSDFELILVNDGSTDSSYQLCMAYQQNDERIVVIDQQNAGVSAARNKGLTTARGSYIGFVDSDDTIEIDMYEMLINNIVAENADISICRLQTVFPNKTVKPTEQPGKRIYNHLQALELFFQEQFDLSANNKLYSASLLHNIKFEGRIYEDILFCCKAFLATQVIVFENKVKYNYLVRENSVSMSKFNPSYLETIVVSNRMVNLMGNENKEIIDQARAFDVMVNVSLLNLLLVSGNRHYQETYTQVLYNLKCNKPFITSSPRVRRKHKYAVFAFLAFPHVYRVLMYAYCYITKSELIKRAA